MNNKIVYVELKSGYADNGPAWIGDAAYSQSGRTVYFNGNALVAIGGRGIGANYMDVKTGEAYWISGVKKDQQDRHWAGGGKVLIDSDVVDAYLKLVGRSELDSRRFETTRLDNDFESVKARNHVRENQGLGV